MRRLDLNDEWLLKTKETCNNYGELARLYNLEFGTEYTRLQIKNYCYGTLKTRTNNYYYTKEQNEWLTANYPLYGGEKTMLAFNDTYNQKRSRESIVEHCRELGLSINENVRADIWKQCQKDTVDILRRPAGTVGRKTNGYMMIKNEDGSWEYLHRKLYAGKINNNSAVVFLDGDKENYSEDNLACIPKRYQALINQNFKIESNQKEVMKTAIKWCELYERLE